MNKELSVEEFLEKKEDFSPFLVHLTRDDGEFCAKDILDTILVENTLKAYNHYCYFSPALNKSQSISLQYKFKVVCFTETPIGQIDVLLNKVSQRNFNPEPYGLVFQKEYIREMGGNPVFYVNRKIANPLMNLIFYPHVENTAQVSDDVCRLLALVTICEKYNDWHWERDWRIVGNLEFKYKDSYCGLCPEEDIAYFGNKYTEVRFISPYWRSNRILSKLVGK